MDACPSHVCTLVSPSVVVPNNCLLNVTPAKHSGWILRNWLWCPQQFLVQCWMLTQNHHPHYHSGTHLHSHISFALPKLSSMFPAPASLLDSYAGRNDAPHHRWRLPTWMAELAATTQTSKGTSSNPCPCQGSMIGRQLGLSQTPVQSWEPSSSFLDEQENSVVFCRWSNQTTAQLQCSQRMLCGMCTPVPSYHGMSILDHKNP